jgi:hypothetical protein
MILRRVIEHVRDRNWFAVGIDFLIVVTGVFIGIQVVNWNDARREQQVLAASLENLAQEISNTAWHRTDQIEWMKHVLAGLGLMLEALDGRELTTEEWGQVHVSLASSASLPHDPGRYETLYELQGTGMLRKLPSRDLRAALGELLSQDKLRQPYLEELSRNITAPAFTPDAVHYGLVDVNRGGEELRMMRGLSVDLARARSDPQFRQRVLQGYSVFSLGISQSRSSRRMDCVMLALLAAEGYEPSGHWLREHIDRIVPGAGDKTLPPPCEDAP